MPRFSVRSAVGVLALLAAAWALVRHLRPREDGTILVVDQHGWYARIPLEAYRRGVIDPFSWVVGAGPDAASPVLFAKFGEAAATARGEEVCGVESAARLHPESPVVILTTASFNATPFEPLRRAYGDRIRLLNVPDLVARLKADGGLPELVAWYRRGKWRDGYPLNNLSNGLRIALVYLFGGRYFDMDILHVRSSAPLRNAVVWENDGTRVNNAVLVFDRRHDFVRALGQQFAQHFNGMWWGANGPHRVTEALQALCGAFNATRRPPERPAFCDDVQVLPSRTYYPMHFTQAAEFFTAVDGAAAVDYAAQPDVYGVHVWSSIPKAAGTTARPGSALHRLAEQACPLTLAAFGLDAFAPLPGRTSADYQEPPRDLL